MHTQRIEDLGIRPAVTLNAMDETEAEREQTQEEVIEAIQMMPEECSRDEILAAVQHTTKGKGKGKGGQRKGPTTKRCYTCQEVGHTARHCPKVRAAQGGTGKGRLMTTRGTDTRTCYNYGKPGHIARDCYSKPQNTAAVEEEDVPHNVLGLEEGWTPVRRASEYREPVSRVGRRRKHAKYALGILAAGR